jgi:hypothetical protein
MIESVFFNSKTRKLIPLLSDIQKYKLSIDINDLLPNDFEDFELEITFKYSISKFRNHDYTWADIKNGNIANEFTPKILKLNNGYFVQSNINLGIWEVKKGIVNKLYWKFNPENSAPIAVFSGSKYEKIISQAKPKNNLPKTIQLLFSQQNGIEFSRSLYPFTAVACFTDHCDFDTLENLKLQREFFKLNNIKVTKGFFLNHFSKREDNASIEFDKEEFIKWADDGHELAYHSLSQSLKNFDESQKDFFSFKPPFENISTWIDHGYQHYNFSLYQNLKIDKDLLSNNLANKNISIFWSYIDSGTSSIGVINQLNTKDFTLKSFFNGNKNLELKDRIGVLIKNIIFHYYADEKLILKYMNTAESFKKMINQKNGKNILNFLRNLMSLSLPILKVVLFWNYCKSKTYKLAKYSPLLFKHKIGDNEFYVFQTLEMVDFKKSLSARNIDKLMNEKGVFIAHTYFSVPITYHRGRIFKNSDEIDEEVIRNFNTLGSKIMNKEIWNPTLKEFVSFLSNFEKIILDIDTEGNIVVVNPSTLPYRIVD